MDWNYKVILTGCERDGEVLCYTISYMAAVNYCTVYYFNHTVDAAGLTIRDKEDNNIPW